VRKFLEGDGGIVLAAERHADISVGDLLTHVNGKLVPGADGSGRIQALKALEAESNKRPLSLTFADPYLYRAVFEQSPGLPIAIGGPEEFEMEVKEIEGIGSKRVVVNGFKDVDGVSEKGGVLIGDHLVFINGIAVGAGCRWMGESGGYSLEEVEEMLSNKSNYPAGLTFARPLKSSSDFRGWFTVAPKEERIEMGCSETICISAEAYEQLGIKLAMKSFSDVVVKDLAAVPGPFQILTNTFADKETGTIHLSIESVNGEFVPSFANPKLVRSGMERAWKNDARVEVVFCDDERKVWIQGLTDKK
jgi:predicted CopG family antitoxin